MYDVIIIGSGPAGVAAAIYAARREMKTLVIGKELGGQLVWAAEIENYPGIRTINNYDLIVKMQQHVTAFGVEIKTDEIKKIEKKEDSFTLHTNREIYETKTIILAIGLAPKRLAIPGEEELTGKGVSYCANCDGPFYKDKIVTIVGGGNSALDAAEVMSKIAKKVYLVHRNEQFKAFEALINEVKNKKNIDILYNSEIKKINGKDKVKTVTVFNNQKNSEQDIKTDGVFIEVGRIANTDVAADLVKRDGANQILVDEKCATKTPGVFAAGDVTQVEFKQISIATGQGTIAALAAYQYLQLKQGKNIKVLDRSVKA